MRSLICHLLVCMAMVGWALPKGLDPTQHGLSTLTEKQLLIQRWFASLTYLQDPTSWDGWGDAVTDLNCDGNSCIRYELSGLAYAAAVLGSKTPAYTHLSAKILYDSIVRMIQKPVWQYIELFDDFQSQPSYPDPVAYKNIMYSGHLAQMIALYESITGNMTFSTDGWQFSWGADSEYPDPIPYTSRVLLQAIYNQTSVYEGALGGVPCEPDSIFVICNNYPMNAFLLYDQLHNTAFAPAAVSAWQNTVEKHGVNRLPNVDGADNNYFNLDYLIHPLGIWEPIASVGSDMWALAWMPTWWDYSTASSATLLQDAYHSILDNSQWVLTAATDDTRAQAYLHPGELGNKIFPFNDAITTSFYPMIYKQFSGATSTASAVALKSDKASTAAALLEQVYAYFDANYGHYFDSDGDGVQDSFQYNTALANCTSTSPSTPTSAVGAAEVGDTECETGDYSVWVTSNVVIGSLLPLSSHSADYLRNLFRGKPLYLENIDKPKVEQVDYPHVMVNRAEFVVTETSSKDTGDALIPAPGISAAAPSNITCSCPTAGQLVFTLQPGDNAPTNSHTVLLSSGCDARSGVPGAQTSNTTDTSAANLGPADRVVLSPCTQNTAVLDQYLQHCTSMTLHGEAFTQYKAAAMTMRGEGYIEVTVSGWALAGARSASDDQLPFVLHFHG